MTYSPSPQPQIDWGKIGAWFRGVAERLEKWWQENEETLVPLVRLAHQHVIFDKAGWLPHYTTPFGLIGDDITEEGLSELLDEYYRTNWERVSADFRARLAALNVDDEAKATFCEALDAHGAGFFRATVRLLLPEIERVVRVELLEGTLQQMASLREVRKAVGELGLSELEPSGGGPVFAQFVRMWGHVYEEARTPERVVMLAADPVPNRHAATHGLVVYRSQQNSLNALMMAEFMFQGVAALKATRGQSRSLPRPPSDTRGDRV